MCVYIYTWIWYNLNTFLKCRKNIYATPVYSNGHIIYSFKDDIRLSYVRYFIWWDTHDTKFPHLQEMDGTNIKKLRIFLVIAVVPSKERLPSMTQRLVRHTSQSQRRRRWESQAKKNIEQHSMSNRGNACKQILGDPLANGTWMFSFPKNDGAPPHTHVDGIKYVNDLVARPFSETSIFFLAKTKEEDFYAEPWDREVGNIVDTIFVSVFGCSGQTLRDSQQDKSQDPLLPKWPLIAWCWAGRHDIVLLTASSLWNHNEPFSIRRESHFAEVKADAAEEEIEEFKKPPLAVLLATVGRI